MLNLSKCARQQNFVAAADWLKTLFLFLAVIFLFPLTLTARQKKNDLSIFTGAAELFSVISQINNQTTELLAGQTITRQIAPGETHFYTVTLSAGQFLNAVSNAKFDAVLSLYDSAGKVLNEVDYTTGRRDFRRMLFVAETGGNYQLRVRKSETVNSASEYTIKIEELRTATVQDEANIAAERIFGEASRLSVKDDGEAKKQAAAKYEEALSLFRKNGDRLGEARTLTKLGEMLASSLSDYKRALEYDNQALPIWRELKDRTEEAAALNEIGLCLDNLGDWQKGLDYYNQALPIRREVKDIFGEAVTLDSIGAVYSNLGDQQKGIDYFMQALPLRRLAGDPSGEAVTLGNIAASSRYLGENEKALDFYGQQLKISRLIKSRDDEAYALDGIATIYAGQGESQKALDYFNEALTLARSTGERETQAGALSKIGAVYSTLGDTSRALEFYNLSLQIRRETGDRRGESLTLTNIGNINMRLKDYAKALEFYTQSLALSRAIKNPATESQSLNAIGNAYYALGDKSNALRYQTEALPIARASKFIFSEAVIVNSLGIIYRDAGEWTKALESFNRALELNRALGNKYAQAATLYHLAILEKRRGQLNDALTQVESALAIVESFRSNIAGNALRTSYLASVQDYYNLRTEILMRLHKERPDGNFDALALESAEKTRARSLIDLLNESHADIKQGVDTALLEQEKALRLTLAAKSNYQTRILGGKHTAEQETAINEEIKKLSDEYEKIETEIRVKSPRYAALTQPTITSVKEIQTQILDRDTVLLEYALGEETSYLWVVSQNSLISFELPKRADIENVARQMYEILTTRNQNPEDETDEQRNSRISRTEKDFSAASIALSKMILAPAAAELKNKRLLIVADGALQYVPFAALESQNPKIEARFLVETNEIVALPSASTLALLRSESANKPKIKTNSIAIVADPVFDADDLRVSRIAEAQTKLSGNLSQNALTGSQNPASKTTPNIERATRETGLENFARLRFSRDEAAAISALAPRRNLFEAMDFAASKKNVLSDDFGKHRIIHLATHGLINSQNPELSGIVLSLVDEKGDAQDGFLRLFEIYNLKLETDLVVLSACQTALGRDVRGEGLIGLTRGFMYAGAPRVVASLWSIDDRATAELMKKFYVRMLRDKMSPANALRAAQIEMLKTVRWQNPYYWAAFTLQGEWK
jgi:CHAT domain-containing protein/Tfp pilus assembly protein PilF